MTSLLLGLALAQDRAIQFPDVRGSQTLVCDFHTHSVFSDGSVFPDIRVEEARLDGLDCIAITEHLEHQPLAADVPNKDRNRAFEVATLAAKADELDLIVIPGAEITRAMPPGHLNAVFLPDANAPNKKKKPEDAVEAAIEQGAFVFWNHPNWTYQRADGIARLEPIHQDWLDKGWLRGIEVVNDHTFSDEALQLALDHDLTIFGNSDIHGIVDWEYRIPEGGHRPVTLVFAAERTPEAIHQALKDRQTAAWFEDTLVGRAAVLEPLIAASLAVEDARYGEEDVVLAVRVTNRSDAPFVLKNTSGYTFHDSADVRVIAPHATTTVRIKTREPLEGIRVPFEVLNAVTAPGAHATWVLTAKVDPS